MGIGPDITLNGRGTTAIDTDPTDEEKEEMETIGDIQNLEADPEQFDRTFLATKEEFGIGGGISPPAPYPLQVIPRVAYTINFQMVYNEGEDRWEPQNPFSIGEVVLDQEVSLAGNGEDALDIGVGPDELGPDTLWPTVAVLSAGANEAIDISHSVNTTDADLLFNIDLSFDRTTHFLIVDNRTGSSMTVHAKVVQLTLT